MMIYALLATCALGMWTTDYPTELDDGTRVLRREWQTATLNIQCEYFTRQKPKSETLETTNKYRKNFKTETSTQYTGNVKVSGTVPAGVQTSVETSWDNTVKNSKEEETEIEEHQKLVVEHHDKHWVLVRQLKYTYSLGGRTLTHTEVTDESVLNKRSLRQLRDYKDRCILAAEYMQTRYGVVGDNTATTISTEVERLVYYKWVPCTEGQELPDGVVYCGNSIVYGHVYVAKIGNTLGKVSAVQKPEGQKVNTFSVPGFESKTGEILVTNAKCRVVKMFSKLDQRRAAILLPGLFLLGFGDRIMDLIRSEETTTTEHQAHDIIVEVPEYLEERFFL